MRCCANCSRTVTNPRPPTAHTDCPLIITAQRRVLQSCILGFVDLDSVTLRSSRPHWRRQGRALVALVAGLAFSGLSIARAPQFDSTDLHPPHPTRFAECPEFFANGRSPAIAPRPGLRELCYEAFAVLHSGETKTPVYVAQRLNRRTLEDAEERRAKRFFADARLPRGERAELDDYKHSGYSRGTWPLRETCAHRRRWLRELQPGQHGSAECPAQRRCLEPDRAGHAALRAPGQRRCVHHHRASVF